MASLLQTPVRSHTRSSAPDQQDLLRCCSLKHLPRKSQREATWTRRWTSTLGTRRHGSRVQQHTLQPVRAMLADDELKPGIEKGMKVKVVQPVMVYHAPKTPELNLEGMEGEVQDIVKFYKGQELSANLPYKVAFALPTAEGEKKKKLICHLTASEIEAV